MKRQFFTTWFASAWAKYKSVWRMISSAIWRAAPMGNTKCPTTTRTLGSPGAEWSQRTASNVSLTASFSGCDPVNRSANMSGAQCVSINFSSAISSPPPKNYRTYGRGLPAESNYAAEPVYKNLAANSGGSDD